MTVTSHTNNIWRRRGYDDGTAGKTQRAPLRDDGGEAFGSYMAGYRAAMRERGKRVAS